jgi:hypothetical protein
MAVFAIASMLFATANSWFAARVGEEVGHRLRVTQYSRIAGLSWGNVDRLETSDLLVRLTTDVNQVRTVTTNSVTTLLRAPLMIVGAIGILLAIDARLALVMALFLPIVIGVLAFYQRTGAPLYRAVLARFDGLNQVLQENMAGVRVVKAFVRGDYENARFDRHNRDLQAAATAAQRSAALLNPALLLVVNLGLAGALWVGGGLVIDQQIELGAVFVLLNYLVAVMIPLVLLSVLLPQIASADSSVGRILRGDPRGPRRAGPPGRPGPAGRGGRRGARARGVRERQLRLPRRRWPAQPEPGAAGHRPGRRAGAGGGDPGRDRVGQVDPCQSRHAFVRRDRRAGDDRRRRCPRRHAGVAARGGHAGPAAAEPVQRHPGDEYRVRGVGRRPGDGRRRHRGAGRRGRGVHRGSPGRVPR